MDGQKFIKVFDLISDLINGKSPLNADFYAYSLGEINSVFDFDFIGIYFTSESDYEIKSFIGNKVELGEDVKSIIFSHNSNEPLLLENNYNCFSSDIKNVLISKLYIKNSCFGFVMALSKNKLEKAEVCAFSSLVSIFSYLIKDYELNDVVKMQLKALQEAIVEKNNAYEVIEKQHKKLLELDETKNAFLANISHELRTPLNAIIGFSQALGCKIFGELNEKQEEYIKDIQISGLHLLGMINEILDLSKIESKAMKASFNEISPQSVIQEAINILSPLAQQKSISVEFTSGCDSNIKSDYQKFQQILYNLLSNAIKFTPENGKIHIRTKCIDNDFVLEVQDNGIGIDKKYHNKIFTKFVHLNNIYSKSQSSTGLGLTITKELVKLLKGKITLESALGKGTTFKIVFKKALV